MLTVTGISNQGRHDRSRRLVVVAYLLVIAASTLAQEVAAQRSVATDRAALVALHEATGGAGWRNRTNWLSDAPIGDWHGVVTDDDGRVSELWLGDNGLTGTLPSEIGHLSHLRRVRFWDNAVTGPIPGTFWSLPLEHVSLFRNPVTGSLPLTVGELVDSQGPGSQLHGDTAVPQTFK